MVPEYTVGQFRSVFRDKTAVTVLVSVFFGEWVGLPFTERPGIGN